MALLAVQEVTTPGGIVPTDADAAGDMYENDGQTNLFVFNQSGQALTVTFKGQRPPNHPDEPLVDRVMDPINNGSFALFPSTAYRFFNDTNGRVHVEYSVAAGVVVRPIRIPEER